jgi:hypothetical protein
MGGGGDGGGGLGGGGGGWKVEVLLYMLESRELKCL